MNHPFYPRLYPTRIRAFLLARARRLPLVSAFLAAVALARIGTLSAQTVDFDTPGDLANDFTINGSTGNFAQVPSGGVSGGAVDVLTDNASDTAIFKTAVASGAGQTVSTSIFFRYDRALRDFTHDRTPIRLGFATSPTVPTSPDNPNVGLDAGAHIQALSGFGGMRFVCSAGSDSQTVWAFANLLDGHWYRFILDLTITGNGDNALNFKTFVQDYGTNGQAPTAKRIVAAATLNSASVTQAAQLYAGFYAQKDGGTDLLDNFSVMNGSTPTMGADLALVVTADRDPVALSRYVTYIATVTNNGPGYSGEVFYEAYLPPGEAYESLTCDQFCYPDNYGDYISVSLDFLAPGASRQVYLTARVLSQGPLTVDSYVRASAVEDDFPKNNSASVTTNVTPAPPVPAFSAVVAPATITLGQSTRDSVTLSGANPTGEIFFEIYGPNDAGCNTSPIRSSVTVHGNGTYFSDSYTPSAAGTYRYIASYFGPGDDYNADVIGQCGDPGQTVTVTAATTPTPTPTPTPSPSPPATPSQFANIATRLNVGRDDNVLIGGFIINGPSGVVKKVLLRGIGPSLNVNGVPVPGRLSDPLVELHNPDGTVVTNDNWAETADAGDIPGNLRPTDSRESVILISLLPGAYTAIMKGAHGETGVGLVEAYDIDAVSSGKLANIATRGFVQTGDNVMIGGFIVTGPAGGTTKVIVRGIGPSLNVNGAPVPGRISDPLLELHKPDGTTATNDDWRDGINPADLPVNLQPTDDRESVIVTTLAPGAYTVIMKGAHGETGVGLIEAYQSDN